MKITSEKKKIKHEKSSIFTRKFRILNSVALHSSPHRLSLTSLMLLLILQVKIIMQNMLSTRFRVFAAIHSRIGSLRAPYVWALNAYHRAAGVAVAAAVLRIRCVKRARRKKCMRKILSFLRPHNSLYNMLVSRWMEPIAPNSCASIMYFHSLIYFI